MHPSRSVFGGLLLGALALSVAGCVQETPTTLSASLAASADVNPDPGGRPSPVVVRVYELRNLKAFDSAGFFDIYEDAQTVLGPDMLNWSEVRLAPGESRQLNLQLHSDTRFLGVVAGYQAIDDSRWRGSVSITPNQANAAVINLERLALAARPG
jgi:type VI secretion system protein VasD